MYLVDDLLGSAVYPVVQYHHHYQGQVERTDGRVQLLQYQLVNHVLNHKKLLADIIIITFFLQNLFNLGVTTFFYKMYYTA